MPATISGSSPAPDVSATVPTKRIQKVGRRTVDTSQDKDDRKKKALSFYDKIKVLDYMRAHHLPRNKLLITGKRMVIKAGFHKRTSRFG